MQQGTLPDLVLPVIKGLDRFAFNLADREQGVSGGLLGSQFDVVLSSLQGQDNVKRVGQADVSIAHLFLGPGDCQIEAGGHLVEKNPDINRSCKERLIRLKL